MSRRSTGPVRRGPVRRGPIRRGPWCAAVALAGGLARAARADEGGAVLELAPGPGTEDAIGAGRHVLWVAGDEEYRSEEALPELARLLALRHGFRCTVVFSIDPETGEIDPNERTHLPGLARVRDADLLVIATRFRAPSDAAMEALDAYLRAGRPVVGLRTATHAFRFPPDSRWARYSDGYDGEEEGWRGGFGRVVLGERWIGHHGRHGAEGTRGALAPGAARHPILRGVDPGEVWSPTDVYAVRLPLPAGTTPLLLGVVLDGTARDAPPKEGDTPLMPIAWTRTYRVPGGAPGRAFTATIGAAQDLVAPGTRRLLVQGCVWALGLEEEIPTEGLDVRPVGPYAPSPFGFGRHRRGVRPSDLAHLAQDARRPVGGSGTGEN